MSRSAATTLIWWSLCGGVANAGEATPRIGFVFNKIEAGFMTYECTPTKDSEIICKFTSASVSKVANPSDWFNRQKKAAAEFKAERLDNPVKFCEQNREMKEKFDSHIAQLRSGDLKIDGARLQDYEITFIKRLIDASIKFCDNPSVANFVEIDKINFEKELNTCRVFSNSFSHKFRKLSDSDTWVVADQPSGDCGVINVSRFEKDEFNKIAFWNYYSRKVVTRKIAQTGALSCSNIDETEYYYTWSSKERAMDCKFVKFGF